MSALFPPSSRSDFPNLSCTLRATRFPTFVLPVKEMRGRLGKKTEEKS